MQAEMNAHYEIGVLLRSVELIKELQSSYEARVKSPFKQATLLIEIEREIYLIKKKWLNKKKKTILANKLF